MLSALLIFAVFYVMLPAINLKDRTFITFLIICIGIVLVVNFFSYVLAFLSSIGDKSVSFKDGVERPLKYGLGLEMCIRDRHRPHRRGFK